MYDLIKDYVDLIIAMKDIDYGSKTSVVINNRRADRIRKIAADIEKKHPELKEQFLMLISSNNSDIKLWAAHHMLEVMSYGKDEQEKALEVIRQKAKEDSVDGLGNRIWLEGWMQNSQNKG